MELSKFTWAKKCRVLMFYIKGKKTWSGWSRSVMQFMNYEAFFNKSVLG